MEITKGIDGYLRIDLPSIGMITFARDLDDACEAIGEACLINQLVKSKYISA